MSEADPGRILGRALVVWGLGHLALGRTLTGTALIGAEIAWLALLAWLTIGLADTSAYLVPFLAGVAFLVAWAWQAVAAYRVARAAHLGHDPERPPERSPALAVGWLALPILAWGAGFWLIGAGAATPGAALDRFVTAWTADALSTDAWPLDVVDTAQEAATGLGTSADRFRDVRVGISAADDGHATAVAEAIHFERRESRFLWVFAGSELVPVADRTVLRLDLAAHPAELPGGLDVGALRWQIVGARLP